MHTTPPKYSKPEFERRWLVSMVQCAQAGRPERTRLIEDKYVLGTQLRIRKVEEHGIEPIYKMGKKYVRTGPSQPTVSVYLSEQEYEALSCLVGRVAKKERQTVAGGSLDIYIVPTHGFAIFEVEFESGEASLCYSPPNFVGHEVTADPEFTGHALARAA